MTVSSILFVWLCTAQAPATAPADPPSPAATTSVPDEAETQSADDPSVPAPPPEASALDTETQAQPSPAAASTSGSTAPTDKPAPLWAPALGAAVASGATQVLFGGAAVALYLAGPDASSSPTTGRFWVFVGFSASAIGAIVGPTLAAYGVARLIASIQGASDPAEVAWNAGAGDLRGAIGGGLVGATALGGLAALLVGLLGASYGADQASGGAGVVSGAIGVGLIGGVLGFALAAPAGVVAGAIIGRPIGAFFVTKQALDRQAEAAAAE